MAKYTVAVDKDLVEIIPGYIATRRKELPELLALFAGGNMDALRKAGHKICGSGGGYGFDRLSELGKDLETACLAGDAAAAEAALAGLKDYLDNLEITYE